MQAAPDTRRLQQKQGVSTDPLGRPVQGLQKPNPVFPPSHGAVVTHALSCHDFLENPLCACLHARVNTHTHTPVFLFCQK